jgi:glycosyltransferase involved in cell wall biosynthesis
VPRNGDHILLLDSSWSLPDVYNRVMRQARLQGCEITSVLYDLVPLKLPAFCDERMSEVFALWIQSALLYSTGFVCISRAVADEFLALLESIRYPRPMKVGYWRLGADLSGGGSVAPLAQSAAPMFLMVGTLEPRKGHRVALDAFTALWRKGFAGTLCIIGRRGWAVEHLAADLKAHPEWGKKLTWLENAGDEVLEAHYAACTALIAASHAEGFGLPIVEAGIHGKPVIASDLPVFREVAGDSDAVTYFAMGSPEALAAAVENFAARHDQTPLIRHDTSVTWAQSAAQLQAVVQEGDWYRTYQPENPATDVALDNIGDWQSAPLKTAAERRHRLELVEGPVAINQGAARKFVVRVTNLSDAVWPGAGAHGVALGLRLGKDPHPKGQVSRIPLVHSPGDTHYVALEIDTRQLGNAAEATIALLQGRDDWWEDDLTVSLR